MFNHQIIIPGCAYWKSDEISTIGFSSHQFSNICTADCTSMPFIVGINLYVTIKRRCLAPYHLLVVDSIQTIDTWNEVSISFKLTLIFTLPNNGANRASKVGGIQIRRSPNRGRRPRKSGGRGLGRRHGEPSPYFFGILNFKSFNLVERYILK